MRNPHLMAVQAGEVTRTNVIGIRKALNAEARRVAGFSIGCTSPKINGTDLAHIERELERVQPRVLGELHDSGKALLEGKRYRKRLEPVADIIADLEGFRLVRFDRLGRYDEYAVPVYKAEARDGRSFEFRVIPWQSGGDGPEVLA